MNYNDLLDESNKVLLKMNTSPCPELEAVSGCDILLLKKNQLIKHRIPKKQSLKADSYLNLWYHPVLPSVVCLY